MNNQQWQQIEGYAATDLNDDYAICLLELRDRVVALEGQQRPATSTEARPSTNEGTSYCGLNMPGQPSQSAAAPSITNCHLSGPAPSPYGSWSEWFEAEGSKGVIHGIRMEALPLRSSSQQEIADAEAFGLTSTSSPLVERVAGAIDSAPYDVDRHQWDEARAAIREVAAWLRDRGGYPWAWVAQTPEQEADRD